MIVDNFDVVLCCLGGMFACACVCTNDRIKNNEKSVVVAVGVVQSLLC